MNRYICVDIGGTEIKLDLRDDKGELVEEFSSIKTPVDLEKQTNNILEAVIAELTEIFNANKDVKGVAVSTAGVVDPEAGVIKYAGYTIPAYIGTDIKGTIEKRFNVPCWVINDVKAAALGELWLGVAKEEGLAICLTIGTGIGGAILLDGELLYGDKFTAGEVGYIPLKDKTWQELASTTFLVSCYRELENLTEDVEINGKVVMKAYDEGSSTAKEAIDIFIDDFTTGLLPLVYALNPRQVIIGGGIMAREDVLLPLIKESLSSKIEAEYFMPEEIKRAKSGNAAGRLGALYNFLRRETGYKA